jgi:glycosyltransferase involved in cell wall biosynthesis
MNSSIPNNPVVMQIIPELGPGGAEQSCIDVAAELVRAGSTAIVISNGGSRVHELKRHGVLHIHLPVDSKNPFIIWRNVKRIRKVIQKYKADIVHARSRAPAWSALLACKKTSACFMTTCHAAYTINKSKLKRFYNSVVARGERVIAISEFIAHYLLDNYKIDQRNIRLVHRGISLEKFHPDNIKPAQIISLAQKWRLPDGAQIIVMPGRLSRIKGHELLIEAVSKLNREDVYCLLIGSDQGRTKYREELIQKISDKNLGGRVRIIDHVDDIAAAYMCATVVVCASIQPEGFGRVPVEAQAMGRPIIATDHGGAAETIIRGETGWLVPVHDSDAMADAINQALQLTEGQRALLATRSMAHVATYFSKEKMLDDTLNVYAELIQEKYNLPNFQPQSQAA